MKTKTSKRKTVPTGRRYDSVISMLLAEQAIECDRLYQKIRRLEATIAWADGRNGDFPLRQKGEGAYWWRKELCRRATSTDKNDLIQS